jgi:hypothetical protein
MALTLWRLRSISSQWHPIQTPLMMASIISALKFLAKVTSISALFSSFPSFQYYPQLSCLLVSHSALDRCWSNQGKCLRAYFMDTSWWANLYFFGASIAIFWRLKLRVFLHFLLVSRRQFWSSTRPILMLERQLHWLLLGLPSLTGWVYACCPT